MRNILLIEPNYKNKYPPIGLMKIATYHRMLGDNVTFFKGELKQFLLNDVFESCIDKLLQIDSNIDWHFQKRTILKYLKNRKKDDLNAIKFDDSKYPFLIIDCLNSYAQNYRNGLSETQYDRIYITTLFTFYWKITIETIDFFKSFVSDNSKLLVGGVMASLLTKEVEAATGIKPMTGLLDMPGALDQTPEAMNLIIDDLPLDYSILEEIDYVYPTQSAYFTFMTKGCTRKCSFCSVPKLEPTYKPKIETISKFHKIKDRFGEQQNLLLMDNNVLASPNFPEIIQEIKDMGFYKGATFVEPNQLEIALKNLKEGYNDRAYLRKVYDLLTDLLRRAKGSTHTYVMDILGQYELIDRDQVQKDKLIEVAEKLRPTFEKYRAKGKKLRYVDFNQGTDARYVTEELMRLMSEIPIRPLRIAFDYIGMKDKYINAIELAAKYGIKELSNYILYNFNDTPEELYQRLKINVELSERLKIHIYSFPMKFIPLFGEEAKDRQYVGKKWNKKFIRAVQAILNVTKGIVAPPRDFFEKAFGRDINEFYHLLYMPEPYIIYRKVFDTDYNLTEIWRRQFDDLMNSSKSELVKKIISSYDFKNIESITNDKDILNLMQHYNMKKDDAAQIDKDYQEIKKTFDQLIKENQHHELTLTYDFEDAIVRKRVRASTVAK